MDRLGEFALIIHLKGQVKFIIHDPILIVLELTVVIKHVDLH